MTEGPRRLRETETGPLADSLGLAKQQLPSAERLEQLAARLAQAGVPVHGAEHLEPKPPQDPSGASATASESLGVVGKAIVGAIGVGGAVVGIFLATRGEPGPSQARPSAPAQPIPTLPAEAVEVSEAPQPPRPGRRPKFEPSAEPVVRAAPVAPVQADAPAPEASASVARAATPRPATPERAFAPSTLKPAAPRPREPSAAASPPFGKAEESSASLPGGGSAQSSPTARDGEIELLKQARSALASDPQEALQLTRRCRAEFPRGAYAQEREIIAISALSRLGRMAEAQERAAAFTARYPRSAYLPQIERMLGKSR